ncbi:unnamed protein product [Penicillium salamii]|nr:unnamed protein product [Penicillium salamii]CAG8271608.1 unnamed protein product [Penicillium salamii]
MFLSHRSSAVHSDIVAGANGISGGAIIDHLVKQPDSPISSSLRGVRSSLSAPTQEFDSLQSTSYDRLRRLLSRSGVLCKNVTHAFFPSYVHDNDFSVLHVKNGPLFRNFLEATDLACPGLKRVVLQTGGKDTPRYTGPENIVYYEQEDDLFAIQKRRNIWNYNIIRPWGIIGFSWQYLGINETLPIGQYFLICRELGEAPRWPGTLKSWHRVESQSFAPGIADLTIWAATHDQCKDEAFKHVDSDVIFWKHLWHLLAEYFKAPMADFEAPAEETKSFDMAEWAKDKKSTWEKIVARSGGDAEVFQLEDFALMNWYITPSLQKGPFPGTSGKARDLGWQRSDDTYHAWLGTMRAYENAGVLPMS